MIVNCQFASDSWGHRNGSAQKVELSAECRQGCVRGKGNKNIDSQKFHVVNSPEGDLSLARSFSLLKIARFRLNVYLICNYV